MMLEKGTLKNQNEKTELIYIVNFLKNVFFVIKEEAMDMKKKQLNSKKNTNFEEGCVYGYYRVLKLVKQHLEGSGIPFSIFSLSDFDPDKEL